MPTVRLTQLLQPLAGGANTVDAAGATLRAVLEDVARQHPDLRGRIVEDGAIRPDVMIALDGDEVRDLNAPVAAASEVQVLPAIAGG